MKEVWKDIRGYTSSYQVSSLGRFRSLDRIVNGKRGGRFYLRRGKIMRLSLDSGGYLQIGLTKNAEQIHHLAHRLVAKAFKKNPLRKKFVNHKNGIKTDIRAVNLEWCTKSENAIHSFVIGLQDNKGENHPSHRLTNKIVRQIRKAHKHGVYGCQRLSVKFGVSKTHIKDIIKRKSWKHI